MEGAVSRVLIVDEEDPRLGDGYALPLVVIEATLDADRLSRKDLPTAFTEVDGTFALPVDETGAGYLDYYARIIVRKNGFNTLVDDIRIPAPDKRLLITLARGGDRYVPDPKDLMEETLEISEPYIP